MKKAIIAIVIIILLALFSLSEVRVENENSCIFLFKTKLQKEKAKPQKGTVIEFRTRKTTVKIVFSVFSPKQWLSFLLKLLDVIIKKFIE